MNALSFPVLLTTFWRMAGWALSPCLKRYLSVRLLHKGDPSLRIKERYGIPSISSAPFLKPDRPRLWIHAASVGETLSVFPLIDALLEKDSLLIILLTTTTATGAETCARHSAFGTRLHHQFIPYDTPPWINRFLNYWQPNAALFVESEFWPGIIEACRRRAIPWMVANARLSERSFNRWSHIPSLFQHLLSQASWIAPRNDDDREHFEMLGISSLAETGDLKEDASPLPSSPFEEKRLRAIIGTRPVFVAASTHEGEEEIIAHAVAYTARYQPNILAIIVPRHPERGPALAQQLKAPCRSLGEDPSSTNALWIADTLGELGLFYRIAGHVFVGNSLCLPGGGHNPFEPLRLECPTAVGPYMGNWRYACQKLHGSLTQISDSSSLASWLMTKHSRPLPLNDKQSITQQLCIRILDTISAHSQTP